jgi:hypothetical protein
MYTAKLNGHGIDKNPKLYTLKGIVGSYALKLYGVKNIKMIIHVGYQTVIKLKDGNRKVIKYERA